MLGISVWKSEYLACLMHDEDIDIVTVQEAHAGSEENLRRRGTMTGYTLIGAVYSNVHGIATYVKASLSNCRFLYQDHSHDVHSLAVEAVNVYKPPSASWSNVSLTVFPYLAIYVGDFNSHNHLWGYEHNDADGNRLFEWMTLNKLHLIYHPRNF
jgi:exonuclease III